MYRVEISQAERNHNQALYNRKFDKKMTRGEGGGKENCKVVKVV